MDTPIETCISLCTGYGGIELGIEAALGRNMRVIAYSEIETHAIEILLARMEQGQLPTAPIWDNLKTFPGEQFHGMVDIITGGFPCFISGTLILTKDGHRCIEDVCVGDMVLTHLGRWRKITAIMRKDGARLRRITGGGFHEIICTHEHPFYNRERYLVWKNEPRKYIREWSTPKWEPADVLTRDSFVAQCLPEKTISSGKSHDLLWLVGRYIADGFYGKSKTAHCGRVVFDIGNKKIPEFESVLDASGFHYLTEDRPGCRRYIIVKKWLYEYLHQFGRYSYGKYLPGWCFELPDGEASALLNGYLSGDGHRSRNSRGKGYNEKFISVSPALAYGMALLAQRVRGVVGSIYWHKPNRECRIEGRLVNERPYHTVTIPERNKCAFVEGIYGWKQIKKNEEYGIGTVYNLAVEEDESYTANNVVVHNCQPFSQSGQRNGTDDPRHLFPYIIKIITAVNPRYVFFENVEGICSSKLKGTEGTDPEGTPVLLHVLRELERIGYTTSWGIFSANEVGAPHRRKRIFITGIRQA